MRIKSILLSVTIALALEFFSFASAATPSSIAVNIAPDNPAPGQSVTVSLSSYANNLDSVNITWFVNGKNSGSGIGRKSFTLDAPAAGSETTVTARVDLPEGAVETRVVIRPGSLELLWEATDSYVPPFYKGKALPVADSEIRVVAMPEVKGASAKNMTYSWKKDFANMSGESGYGKNFFTFVNDYLDGANTVSVVASTLTGVSSEKSVVIGTVLPKISFYSQSPETGTDWNKTIETGHRIDGEETIVAVPYFISPAHIGHPDLVWRWFINNSAVATQAFTKNVLPVRAEAGVTGTSNISLQIESINKIFQTASKQINVEF